MIKSFTKSAVGSFATARLIGLYIWLLRKTAPMEIIGLERVVAQFDRGQGVIFAFWHGRLLLATLLVKTSPVAIYMLISTHRDGEIIARGAKVPGLHYIRGSAANPKKAFKDKSGGPAVVQMLAALKQNMAVGITPDGPRGPAEISQHGIIRLAAGSGAPIIPVGLSARHGKHLTSWDGFFLPRPFTRTIAIAGEPIHVQAGSSTEDFIAHREALTRALREVTAQADKKVGKKPVTVHTDPAIDGTSMND